MTAVALAAGISSGFAEDEAKKDKKRPGGAGADRGEFFAKLDKDGNGKITEAEAPQLWARFSARDKDGDGGVSKEELMAGRGGGAPGGARLDANGDGKITKEEAGERWERLSKLDKDGDGAVSKEEMPKRGAGGPGQRPGGDFFGKADKNSDGKITADEAGERWERLSKADTNKDGGVSKEEMMAAMKNRDGQGKRPGADKENAGGGAKPKRPEQDS